MRARLTILRDRKLAPSGEGISSLLGWFDHSLFIWVLLRHYRRWGNIFNLNSFQSFSPFWPRLSHWPFQLVNFESRICQIFPCHSRPSNHRLFWLAGSHTARGKTSHNAVRWCVVLLLILKNRISQHVQLYTKLIWFVNGTITVTPLWPNENIKLSDCSGCRGQKESYLMSWCTGAFFEC